MEEKKKPGKSDRKKRNQQIMILVSALAMVFSGLYIGLGTNNPVPQNSQADYSNRILEYQVYPLGNYSVPVRIDSKEDELALMFTQSGALTQDVVDSILGENITGVRNATFEMSGSYSFFRLVTENATRAAQSVRNILRTRSYVLYSVYSGNTPAGKVSIVGGDMEPGDYAKVLLFQRSREGVFDLIGFSQGVVPFGYVVKAKVTNITGFTYNGVALSYLNPFDFNASEPGASEIRLAQPKVVVDAVNYSTFFNATVSYNENQTVVEAENISGLIEEVKSRNLSYEMIYGGLTFTAPLNSDYNLTVESLGRLGVVNVTRSLTGEAVVPPEITDGSKFIRIPNNRMLSIALKAGIKVGDEINASLSILSLGDYNLVFASQA